MKLTSTFCAWVLIVCAKAQTPSNFTVPSTKPLEVISQPGKVTLTLGLLVPQSAVLDAPSIILPTDQPTTANYVAFMVDLSTTFGILLHWFQPNLIATSNDNLTLTVDVTTTNASTAIGATYIYPQPPAEGFAHQYVILLYHQPPYWTVPSNYSKINPPADLSVRFPFDMADFQRAAGLDEPIGTDYFRVLNGTAEQTSSIATMTPSATATAVASYTANAAAGSGFCGIAAVGWAGMIILPWLL